MNLYAYCGNNPVENSDPYGNWPQWLETVVAVGVGVAVVAAVVAGAVVTGPVAIAVANVALGTSLGALVGGAYNSNNGGSFIDGAIGGAISGFCQSVGTLAGGGLTYNYGWDYYTEPLGIYG